MPSLLSSPVCRKRKSNPKTLFCSNKRARLVGLFEPRCIVPTGARRSWTYAKEPRFILDPATQGTKRSFIEDGELPVSSNCKARILDSRDVVFFPSYKRLSPPQKPQRKRNSISGPGKKSVELRLRRREFTRKRQLQRVDSGICMEYDEGLDLDILFEPMVFEEDFKFFGGVDASAFTGFRVEMMETTETTTGDDMEIEGTSISTTTFAASTAAIEGDADSDPSTAEQTTSSKDTDKKEEPDKDMLINRKKGEEEKGLNSDIEVEDEEKEISEQREADAKLSSKDTAVKERIRKRLGDDELVRLGPSDSKKEVTEEADEDDEDEEPPRQPTRRISSKFSLPTTVEEEGEEDEKEREDDEDIVVIRRRSSRTSKDKEVEEKKKKEVEGEKEIEKKEETKETKKLVRQTAKVEESGSESERDEKRPQKKVVKEEENIEIEEEPIGDKMEEDTDEDSNSSGEDTDMSTDEDITDDIAEDITVVEETIEEDVTMSEDDEMAEEPSEEVSEEKKATKEEVDAETTAKDIEEAEDVEVTSSEEAESREEDQEKLLQTAAASASAEVKKSVRRLVLAPSKQDEPEVAKMLSVPRTPRTPRSPNMSRFNITMSKAPRKINPHTNPLMSPRRSKFNKSEDLSAHWTMKRLAAKKRQQPFNPANISRHAYRDPTNEDELYNFAARKALWEDDEAEDAYVDEYLRVEWTCTTKSWDGRYSSWMVENGSALMEFCVRKLEGFSMGW